MAVYPHTKRLLVGGHDGPMSAHLGFCLHVNESNGNLDNWVADHSHDMSCHFQVYKDGSGTQYVDTELSSWCQMAGNPTYLSCESEGFHTEAYTPAQLTFIAHLFAWSHKVHGIPLQLANQPGEAGLIFHGAGGDAWGGHPDCAGTPRDNARPEIIRRAKNILAGKHPINGGAQDMARFVASDKTHRVYLVVPGQPLQEIHGRANVAVFAELYGMDPTIQLVKHADLELAAQRFGAGPKAHL